MTVLDMLMRRKRKVLRVGATSALVKARSNDDDLAARMAITAALVMEGHDLIGLLRDARAWIPRGYGGPGVAALNARVDAAIDAAEAAGKDGPQ